MEKHPCAPLERNPLATTKAKLRRRPHPPFQVGQRVWLSTKNLNLKLKQINPVSYCHQLPSSYHISPPFHVSPLKPAHNHQEPTGAELPPTLEIEGFPAYLVHSLLDAARVNLWTGKDKVQRNNPGSMPMTSWTLPS